MYNKSIIIGVLICAFSAKASITNVIDLTALASCGTGTTNGWTLSNIDSYSDKTSLRLNNENEFIISPEFEAPIKEIIIKVKSSSQTGRKLAFIPHVSDYFDYVNEVLCQYSPTKDTYIEQHLLFNTEQPATYFKIQLFNPEDGSTGWGLSYLAVITDDPLRFESPKTAFINCIHSKNARISWPHNELVSSYMINVFSIEPCADHATIRQEYDFNLCNNPGKNDTQDKSSDLTKKYPDLSGEKIYYPADSTGVIRLSSGTANGRLSHSGYPDYTNMAVEICAKRYPGDSNLSSICAYYINDHCTNIIGTISVSNDFSTSRISLNDTPGGAVINFGNLDGYKSNRRFLIDRITFYDNYSGNTTTTNTVFTANTTEDRCRITGLKKATTYSATLTAINKDGDSAEPSAPTTFKTPDGGDNFIVLYL